MPLPMPACANPCGLCVSVYLVVLTGQEYGEHRGCTEVPHARSHRGPASAVHSPTFFDFKLERPVVPFITVTVYVPGFVNHDRVSVEF